MTYMHPDRLHLWVLLSIFAMLAGISTCAADIEDATASASDAQLDSDRHTWQICEHVVNECNQSLSLGDGAQTIAAAQACESAYYRLTPDNSNPFSPGKGISRAPDWEGFAPHKFTGRIGSRCFLADFAVGGGFMAYAASTAGSILRSNESAGKPGSTFHHRAFQMNSCNEVPCPPPVHEGAMEVAPAEVWVSQEDVDYKPVLVTAPQAVPAGDVVIAATPAAQAGAESIAVGHPGGTWWTIDVGTLALAAGGLIVSGVAILKAIISRATRATPATLIFDVAPPEFWDQLCDIIGPMGSLCPAPSNPML